MIRPEQAAHTHCSTHSLSVSLFSFSLSLSLLLTILQILVNRRSTVPKGRLPFVLLAVCRKSTRSQRPSPGLPPPGRRLFGRVAAIRVAQSCSAAMGCALVYLLMVYLLIPADYHVRQGRKRDTARGDEAEAHRKHICQRGRSGTGG